MRVFEVGNLGVIGVVRSWLRREGPGNSPELAVVRDRAMQMRRDGAPRSAAPKAARWGASRTGEPAGVAMDAQLAGSLSPRDYHPVGGFNPFRSMDR